MAGALRTTLSIVVADYVNAVRPLTVGVGTPGGLISASRIPLVTAIAAAVEGPVGCRLRTRRGRNVPGGAGYAFGDFPSDVSYASQDVAESHCIFSRA